MIRPITSEALGVKVFDKSFTLQEAVPESGIKRVEQLLRSGRLHRYDMDPGETGEVGLLEREFANYLGVPYCLACASGGYALHIALRAAGVREGEQVLTNAFTLAPVPGAIHNSGAVPVFVELGDDYCIDLDDLEVRAEVSGAHILLLSHMRGHIANMDRVLDICSRHELLLIEDCAHTMGGGWNGRASGSDADIACFSTQTYKHLNSGEGGILTTRHADIMARATILSGSYMLYDRHPAGPSADVYESIRLQTPNYSGRMDHLRPAILRPQLAELPERCQRWNRLYVRLEEGLRQLPSVRVPARAAAEQYVGSSIQFSLPDLSCGEITDLVELCGQRGVSLKWFGAPEPAGYTSRYDSWAYLENLPALPQTESVLATLCDMRIPLTFNETDCELIVAVIGEVLAEVAASGQVGHDR